MKYYIHDLKNSKYDKIQQEPLIILTENRCYPRKWKIYNKVFALISDKKDDRV